MSHDRPPRSSSSPAQPTARRAAPSPPSPTTPSSIAADGGLDHARAAGLDPAVLVGDLDSVSAIGLAWASEHTEVVRHPVDKAATDTELAIAHAATYRPRRIILLAGQGDRLDHAVAALGALGAPELAAVASLEAWWGSDQLHVVHAPRSVDARPARRHDVLRARHARPGHGRHGRPAPAGRSTTTTSPRSSGSASATSADRRRSARPSASPTASSPSSSRERSREPPPPARRHRRRARPRRRRLRGR